MLWVKSRHAVSLLSTVSFAESFIFPIPPDLLLIPLSISNPKKAYYFAMLTTTFSVLGGVIGYLIGIYFSELFLSTLSWIFDEKSVEMTIEWMTEWGVMVVLISGFSPIPYKVFTVASGVAGLAFIPFLIASLLGRGMRFFLIGFIVSKGGNNLEKKLRKYSEVIGWTGLSIFFIYVLFTYLGYF
ncbi:DedA family protein [Betaproteobacteria bacterium]|nr:DedA family protein [Betaproteobacteria bacterium]